MNVSSVGVATILRESGELLDKGFGEGALSGLSIQGLGGIERISVFLLHKVCATSNPFVLKGFNLGPAAVRRGSRSLPCSPEPGTKAVGIRRVTTSEQDGTSSAPTPSPRVISSLSSFSPSPEEDRLLKRMMVKEQDNFGEKLLEMFRSGSLRDCESFKRTLEVAYPRSGSNSPSVSPSVSPSDSPDMMHDYLLEGVRYIIVQRFALKELEDVIKEVSVDSSTEILAQDIQRKLSGKLLKSLDDAERVELGTLTEGEVLLSPVIDLALTKYLEKVREENMGSLDEVRALYLGCSFAELCERLNPSSGDGGVSGEDSAHELAPAPEEYTKNDPVLDHFPYLLRILRYFNCLPEGHPLSIKDIQLKAVFDSALCHSDGMSNAEADGAAAAYIQQKAAEVAKEATRKKVMEEDAEFARHFERKFTDCINLQVRICQARDAERAVGASDDQHVKRLVGFVSADYGLVPGKVVLENLIEICQDWYAAQRGNGIAQEVCIEALLTGVGIVLLASNVSSGETELRQYLDGDSVADSSGGKTLAGWMDSWLNKFIEGNSNMVKKDNRRKCNYELEKYKINNFALLSVGLRDAFHQTADECVRQRMLVAKQNKTDGFDSFTSVVAAKREVEMRVLSYGLVQLWNESWVKVRRRVKLPERPEKSNQEIELTELGSIKDGKYGGGRYLKTMALKKFLWSCTGPDQFAIYSESMPMLDTRYVGADVVIVVLLKEGEERQEVGIVTFSKWRDEQTGEEHMEMPCMFLKDGNQSQGIMGRSVEMLFSIVRESNFYDPEKHRFCGVATNDAMLGLLKGGATQTKQDIGDCRKNLEKYNDIVKSRMAAWMNQQFEIIMKRVAAQQSEESVVAQQSEDPTSVLQQAKEGLILLKKTLTDSLISKKIFFVANSEAVKMKNAEPIVLPNIYYILDYLGAVKGLEPANPKEKEGFIVEICKRMGLSDDGEKESVAAMCYASWEALLPAKQDKRLQDSCERYFKEKHGRLLSSESSNPKPIVLNYGKEGGGAFYVYMPNVFPKTPGASDKNTDMVLPLCRAREGNPLYDNAGAIWVGLESTGVSGEPSVKHMQDSRRRTEANHAEAVRVLEAAQTKEMRELEFKLDTVAATQVQSIVRGYQSRCRRASLRSNSGGGEQRIEGEAPPEGFATSRHINGLRINVKFPDEEADLEPITGGDGQKKKVESPDGELTDAEVEALVGTGDASLAFKRTLARRDVNGCNNGTRLERAASS